MARAARPAAGGGDRSGSRAIRPPSRAPAAPPGLELAGARGGRRARQGEAAATPPRPSRPRGVAASRSAGPGSESGGPAGGPLGGGGWRRSGREGGREGEPRAAAPGGGQGGRKAPARPPGHGAGLGARGRGGRAAGPAAPLHALFAVLRLHVCGSPFPRLLPPSFVFVYLFFGLKGLAKVGLEVSTRFVQPVMLVPALVGALFLC